MRSKRKLFSLVACLAFNSAFTQAIHHKTLIVIAEHFKDSDGQAIANLFVKGESLKKKPAHQLISKIVDGKTTFEFKNLPYGDYAVIIFHDKNANGDLDHSWGMPSEPPGYSNGWRFSIFSGMPTFEKLKLNYSEQNNSIHIKVK